MFDPLWRNSSVSRGVKVKIFKSNVLSVLLYGCSTWKVSKSITSKLQVFINRCLRYIFRVFWPNKITNLELQRRADMEPIDTWIRRQKWRWIGHTLRKDDNCIAKKALEWNPVAATSLPVGRPKVTWRTSVRKEAESIGKSWSELRAIAGNRVRWRGVVTALCPSTRE